MATPRSNRRQRRPIIFDEDDERQGCVELLSGYMPYSTGEKHQVKHVPPGYIYVSAIDGRDAVRVDVFNQTNRIINEFLSMVDTLTWMTDESKRLSRNKGEDE
jgi:hypothetical protein